MRIFLVPLIALALGPAEQGRPEPGEIAMRSAFEATLHTDVQNVLEFLQETAGPQAVERVRTAGMDRFEVRSFRKLGCTRDTRGHVCNFSVEVSVVNGEIAQTMRGHFRAGAGERLTFIQDS